MIDHMRYVEADLHLTQIKPSGGAYMSECACGWFRSTNTRERAREVCGRHRRYCESAWPI